MPGLSRGVGQVEGGIAKSVKRKKVSGLEGEKFMSSLIGTIDYDRFKEVHTLTCQIRTARCLLGRVFSLTNCDKPNRLISIFCKDY